MAHILSARSPLMSHTIIAVLCGLLQARRASCKQKYTERRGHAHVLYILLLVRKSGGWSDPHYASCYQPEFVPLVLCKGGNVLSSDDVFYGDLPVRFTRTVKVDRHRV